MLYNIPLSVVVTTTAHGLQTLLYCGHIGNKPSYNTGGSSTVANMYWDAVNSYWIHSNNNRSWKNPADTPIPPLTGWSPVAHEDSGIATSDTLTVSGRDSLEMPPTLVSTIINRGNFTFDPTVVGWISDTDRFLVLLHPTSPFNLSNKWKYQSKDSVLGYATFEDLSPKYRVPTTVYSVYSGTDIITTFTYTSTTSGALVETVANPASNLLGYVAPINLANLKRASSYTLYTTNLLSGGRSLTPITPNRPGVYNITEIYDPLEDYGKSPAEISKLFVPLPGSIVIDITSTPGKPSLYVVETVAHTAQGPQCILNEFSNQNVAATQSPTYNLASDIAMLFYTQVSGQPTTLSIDNKLEVLAENASKYRILRSNGSVISAMVANNTVMYGDIEITTVNDIPVLTQCVTNYAIVEGDVLTLQVLDNYGGLITELNLLAKPASVLSDLHLPSSVIVDLVIESNQDLNGGFYLLQNQSIDDLMLTPRLIYGDNSIENLSLSTNSGQVYVIDGGVLTYGFDALDSSAAHGTTYTLGFKYYIPRNAFLDATVTENDDINGPYIFKEYTVTIVNINSLSDISKLSIVPSLDDVTWGDTEYTFQPDVSILAYLKSMDVPVTLRGSIAGASSYLHVAATDAGPARTYTLSYNGPLGTFNQVSTLRRNTTVADPLASPVFTLADAESMLLYGGVAPGNISPIPLVTLQTVNAQAVFSIESSIANTVNKFLDTFYYNANPPAVGNTIPVPTHFRIKYPNIDGGSNMFKVASNYVQVASFAANITTVAGLPALPNTSGQIFVLEFYRFVDGVYETLYGVPVLGSVEL
jgi:hypothetical protein